ncbi:hypothetical protein PROFUN_05910 [Planoprotostelium fungivorum]|uniref:cyclin-dependent kinase n=1 Tax=Planoprotostelium fungivorum TaxID=1890364 RepID=A0A2P6N7K4_9EUKA|nr:hypothetical protein PROFUN_05910 [Planoprotostelium fungivorum]
MKVADAGLDKRYQRLSKLGKGNYAKVYLATDLQTKQQVALKKMVIEQAEEGIPSTALREISLLKELSGHTNVVKLLEVHYSPNSGVIYLIFEHLDQDLREYMNNRILDARLTKSYFRQIIKGVHFCHSHRILHRDLKPNNLLIDKTGTIKIADFGLSRAFVVPTTRPYTTEVVTLWYRAPELLLGQGKYSTPVDIWSAGCIFAEMVTSEPLFGGDSEIDQLQKIFLALGTPDEDSWEGVTSLPNYDALVSSSPKHPPQSLAARLPRMDPLGLDLLQKMLVYEPSQRISARDALSHPYFTSVS